MSQAPARSERCSSVESKDRSKREKPYHEIVLENPNAQNLMNQARLELASGMPATRVVPKYAHKLRAYSPEEWISRVMRNALSDLFGSKCSQLDRCMPKEYKRPKAWWRVNFSVGSFHSNGNNGTPVTPSNKPEFPIVLHKNEKNNADVGSKTAGIFRDILNKKSKSPFWM